MECKKIGIECDPGVKEECEKYLKRKKKISNK